MNPLDDALLLEWGDALNGHVRLTIIAEKCDDCGERVHYWNDETGENGDASCGCTVEGPEACGPINLGGSRLALLAVALVQVGIDSRKRDPAGDPVGDLRKTLERKFANTLIMPRDENRVAHELAEAVLSTIDTWTGLHALDAARHAAKLAHADPPRHTDTDTDTDTNTDAGPPRIRSYETFRRYQLELEHQHMKLALRTLRSLLSTPVEISRKTPLKILEMLLDGIDKIDELDRRAKNLTEEIP